MTEDEMAGYPQTRRGLTLLSQLCRDPAVGAETESDQAQGILAEPLSKAEPESGDPNQHTGSCPIIRNYLIVFNKSLNFQVFCYEATADSECFPFWMCTC